MESWFPKLLLHGCVCTMVYAANVVSPHPECSCRESRVRCRSSFYFVNADRHLNPSLAIWTCGMSVVYHRLSWISRGRRPFSIVRSARRIPPGRCGLCHDSELDNLAFHSQARTSKIPFLHALFPKCHLQRYVYIQLTQTQTQTLLRFLPKTNHQPFF